MKFRKTGSSSSTDEYGSPIPFYEYELPKGWTLTSGYVGPGDAPNLVFGTNNVHIQPDALNGGSIKVRAVNTAGLLGCGELFKESKWSTIAISNRPSLSLKSNGQKTISINCGQITPRTFTVENGNLASCATYTWNVSGNWRDANGQPVTAPFTTTTPSIILTPVSNATSAPGNVSVTVSSGSSTFTDVVEVAFTNNPPQLTINEDNTICSSKTYTLTIEDGYVLPTNITWTATPSNMVTITTGPTANSVVVTRNGASSGLITLSASIPAFCSGPNTTATTGTIEVGAPSITQLVSSTFYVSTTTDPAMMDPLDVYWNEVCYSASHSVNMGHINSSISWSRTYANPTNATWYQAGGNLDFYFWGVGQRAIFKASATNSCGTSSIYLPFRSIDCSGGGDDPCNTFYSMSPNPASSNINIAFIPPPCDLGSVSASGTAKTTAARPTGIQQVAVYDVSGNIKLRRSYGKGTQQANLNVSGLKAGLYWVSGYRWPTYRTETTADQKMMAT